MPQDPNLYEQRPAKRQKKEIPLSSSLDFASQLTSLLSSAGSGQHQSPTTSTSTPSVSSGRARPSKTKDDIFSIKAKRKASTNQNAKDDGEDGRGGAKLTLKDPQGTEDEKRDLARARRRMEEKARLYAAMKRGDYVPKEGETAPLVDFDRKWAERHPDSNADHYSSSGTDNSDSEEEGEEEMVDFKDEFGRTRHIPRSEATRLERRSKRSALGALELESMAAKPTRAPERVIYGDVIQSAAFDPGDNTLDRMADLAAKRDKSPTPPPDTHFDGNAEIRTKGVGFYQFSREEGVRKEEMQALEKERDNTEKVRRERDGAREARRREIEERRAKIGAKRAEKLAENFLDGLAGEFGVNVGGEEREAKEDKEKGKESHS
ncbi:uncharacterized protein F4822DRAFT_406496 [Hypoxylon trugodes]|uniref:uncharacterized protein n=1 Tax=Hypoxylon trugodes TaxID=326681 RepID=UPI00219D7E43|nr:uncharacterized protein F4822DRAFT_406496 [Hypoxylon trugodes]KAI1387444.1 hypothetical protein F4822DRAFT_406496 [Hypoxylon trugodes]